MKWCRPNVRAVSRMLISSTITAQRTRRYTSILHIHRTIHGVGYNLWLMAGGTVFNRQIVDVQRKRPR